jgi:hypothetical protein
VGFDERFHPAPHSPNDPIFFHWTSYNGRTSTSKNKIGHVFPAKLSKIKDEEKYLNTETLIGVQIWKTRCNKPRIDLLVYNLTKKTTYLINNCISILSKHYCDFSFALTDVQYEEMIELAYFYQFYILLIKKCFTN